MLVFDSVIPDILFIIVSLFTITIRADYVIYSTLNTTYGEFNDVELCEDTFNTLNFVNDTTPSIYGFLTYPYTLDHLQNATLKIINGTIINYTQYTFSEYGICNGYYYTGVSYLNWSTSDASVGKCGGGFNYSGPYEEFNTLSYSFLGDCHSKESDFIQSTTTYELTTDGCELPDYSVLCLYVSPGTYPETISPTTVPTLVPTTKSPTTKSPTNQPITNSPTQSKAPTTSFPTRSPTVIYKDLRPAMILFGGVLGVVFFSGIFIICCIWLGTKVCFSYGGGYTRVIDEKNAKN